MPVTVELDHVFMCASHSAQKLLEEAGLHCGLNRVHDGQGTSNANFYFDNAYLELLFLRDEVEVRNSAAESLALWKRLNWLRTGACPFGVAFRSKDASVPSKLSSWIYAAPYLPPEFRIPVVTPRNSEPEPLVFFPPGAAESTLATEQKGRRRKLKSVHIETPTGLISSEVGKFLHTGLLAIGRGPAYRMELHFEPSTEVLDFRPALPLLLRW